jgi:hypothetical protein
MRNCCSVQLHVYDYTTTVSYFVCDSAMQEPDVSTAMLQELSLTRSTSRNEHCVHVVLINHYSKALYLCICNVMACQLDLAAVHVAANTQCHICVTMSRAIACMHSAVYAP